MTLKVKGYQRKTKTGQVQNVDPYTSARDAAQDLLRALPGRPPVAGKPGEFPNGRSIPGHFPSPVKAAPPKEMPAAEVASKKKAIRKITAKHEKVALDAGLELDAPHSPEVAESVTHLEAKGYKVKKPKPEAPVAKTNEDGGLEAATKRQQKAADERRKAYREDAKKAAVQVLERAAEAEAETTQVLQDTVARQGGEMSGLEYRLKTQESLERKIHDKAVAKGITPEQYGEKVADALRYTALYPNDQYIQKAEHTLAELQSMGHTIVSVENSWEKGDGYSGVNVELQAPNGLRWELQFHTTESLKVKEQSHKIYDIVRDQTIEFARREREYLRMVSLWDELEQPPGWEAFGQIMFRDDAPKQVALSRYLMTLARGLHG